MANAQNATPSERNAVHNAAHPSRQLHNAHRHPTSRDCRNRNQPGEPGIGFQRAQPRRQDLWEACGAESLDDVGGVCC